jgi:hypothetical protein
MFRRFQPLGLRRQMTGNLLIEPALDLGGQMNDLGRHSVVLFSSPANAGVTPDLGVENAYSMSR